MVFKEMFPLYVNSKVWVRNIIDRPCLEDDAKKYGAVSLHNENTGNFQAVWLTKPEINEMIESLKQVAETLDD